MNAVVFLADGFEEIEAFTVIDYLRRANILVTTVAVPSKTMESELIVKAAHGISVFADISFDEFKCNYNENLPDLVFVPGGMPGAVNVSLCTDVLDFIIKCFKNQKIVSAICAAPAVVLSKTGILKNKKWTCYPGMEENVDLSLVSGSSHLSTVPFVIDDNLVTGRGPGCAEQFSMELVGMLCGQEVVLRIKKASVQR